MRRFGRLRRFVDRDLDGIEPFRPATFSIGAATLILGAPLFSLDRPYSPAAKGVVAVAVAAALAWSCFVGWRAYRLIRAGGIRADREFDRRGKYSLPPEYARTESATKARRRR